MKVGLAGTANKKGRLQVIFFLQLYQVQIKKYIALIKYWGALTVCTIVLITQLMLIVHNMPYISLFSN